MIRPADCRSLSDSTRTEPLSANGAKLPIWKSRNEGAFNSQANVIERDPESSRLMNLIPQTAVGAALIAASAWTTAATAAPFVATFGVARVRVTTHGVIAISSHAAVAGSHHHGSAAAIRGITSLHGGCLRLRDGTRWHLTVSRRSQAGQEGQRCTKEPGTCHVGIPQQCDERTGAANPAESGYMVCIGCASRDNDSIWSGYDDCSAS